MDDKLGKAVYPAQNDWARFRERANFWCPRLRERPEFVSTFGMVCFPTVTAIQEEFPRGR